jgi:solute carrier family 13 (sodium-dependent dicarboxylate transporter), member 2/3/5
MRRPSISLVLGPALAMIAAWLCIEQQQGFAFATTVALTVWCGIWWLTEPVPAPVTALLPLAVLPIFNILSAKEVAQSYGHELILLLAGGFMLSRALEKSGAHKRLAITMVNAFGGRSGRHLLYGFIAATGFISMWISNTATTLLMLPVAIAILETYPDKRLQVPLILSIAYAASIGGMGTPIGSPTNLVFMQVYQQSTGIAYGFFDWMKIGVPVCVISLFFLAIWLGRHLRTTPAAQLPGIGAWTSAERRVLTVFAITAAAWIFRSEPFGGWSKWLMLEKANDASVALIAVIALCVISDGKEGRLLDWVAAEKIPWGALILFGGGIALATAFEKSGLSNAIGQQLTGLQHWPLPLLLFGMMMGIALLSEIASNTATAVLLMPILAATAKAMNVEPALLMYPAVLAASVGFMLPVATAPNAIAYGTEKVSTRDMIKEGAMMDVLCVIILSVSCWLAFR